MASTLDTYGPFNGTPQYEDFWRDMMKHMLGSSSGVVRGFGFDFLAFGDSSGMQVKVNSGECWVRGHYGKSTGTKTIPIASNATGSTRIDRVVLRADFVNNRIEVDVLTGTTSAPAVTQNSSIWETSLALVSVPNGAVTISAGNVTDERVYTTVVGKYARTSTTSVPVSGGSYADVVLNSTEIPTGDIALNTSTGVITLGRSGVWQISAIVGFSASGSGGRRVQITTSSGATVYARNDCPNMGTTEPTYIGCSTTEKFNAGQTLKLRVWQNGASAVNTIAGEATLSAAWLGP
ncbi:hypothetical protein [Actinophytocola sp. NPDC049390]|uniref:hypothetical protein n=1 Tax=Actinophytocola sp. NPDC049390 TaxID=3363894 RepID=UPI00379B75AE